MHSISVLIVGSGPVGLSMALALARQNINVLVIERNPSTTEHPRARGVNTRTMELFRQWGNHTELLQYEQPKEARRFIWVKSFQGEEITRITMDTSNSHSYSPVEDGLVSQDRVEQSLYHTLSNYKNANVQFLKEFISFKQDDSGVTIQILDKQTMQTEFIHAQFLIAADGTRSNIRNQLGIAMEGPNNLGQSCSIYCDIDISAWTKHRPCAGFLFGNSKFSSRPYLASVDGVNRWIAMLRFTEGITKEDFTDEYCTNEIRHILDLPNLTVNIINKNFWRMAAQMANQYKDGRVFLIGDAAHILPPTGGFGMNTGIQDAHNLAWKIAFVIKYNIPDTILDTYYEERAPIAKQNIDWSTENAKLYTEIYKAISIDDMELLKTKLHEQHRNLNYSGLDLGFIYHSNIIFSENDQKLNGIPSQYILTTLPGSRVPHIELIKDSKTISSLDLFEKEFVLLIGPDGESWRTIAYELASKLVFPLKVYKIANDGDLIDSANTWEYIYGMSNNGAILVRPDGHVAWRSRSIPSNDKHELEKYFKSYR